MIFSASILLLYTFSLSFVTSTIHRIYIFTFFSRFFETKVHIYSLLLVVLIVMNSSPQTASYSHGRIACTPPNSTRLHQKGFAPIDTTQNFNYHYIKQVPPNFQEFHQSNSSSFRQAHIISPSKQVPEGYVCVGKILEQEKQQIPLANSLTSGQNGHYYLSKENTNPSAILPYKTEFPPSFNPRTASNMSVKEKVSKWIQKVPFASVSGMNQSFGGKKMYCYSGIVQSSSESESSETLDNIDIQDILEIQSRRITRFVTKFYRTENETIAQHDSEYEKIGGPYESEDIMHLEGSIDNYLEGKRSLMNEYINLEYIQKY